MKQNSSKIKTFLSLLTPSGIGLVLYIFVSGTVIFMHQIPQIEQYMEIPRNFSLFRLITGWLDHLLNGSIGEARTQTLVVGLFWALVGLGVYLFLQGIARFITEFSEGLDEREYLWPKGVDRNRGVVEAMRRTMFRILAFIGLIVVIFGPLERVLSGPILEVFLGPSPIVRLGGWFIASCLTMHIFVVLLRLVVLRPRLFN
jgi:hypothetical protein